MMEGGTRANRGAWQRAEDVDGKCLGKAEDSVEWREIERRAGHDRAGQGKVRQGMARQRRI